MDVALVAAYVVEIDEALVTVQAVLEFIKENRQWGGRPHPKQV